MQVIRTVTTTTPLERVFSYLADFTTTTDWDPGTVRTTRLSGDGGPGTRYLNVSRFGGRETSLEYVVTELQQGRMLRLRGENGSVVAHDELTFDGDGERTRVTYRAELRPKGWRVVAAPLVALAFRRLADDAEQSLHRVLSRL
jgi:uncharacterized protein YndB with AHSA1/START domain